ncbi:MAG: hypothetical protein ACRDKT_13630 [Actinomycetota bacterium]
MRSRRFFRVLTLLATASLLVGVFAAVPADAKKKKKNKAKACATYQPGSNGEGQPVSVVTDAATAEKPVSLEVEVGPGLGAGRNPEGEGAFVSHAYANLMVDSKAPSVDLNAQIVFTPVFDYDLYLDTADGTELASSAGFGPIAFGSSDYEQSDVGSETIAMFPASDCDGFTIDVVGATTPGETVTVNYWLGEAPE